MTSLCRAVLLGAMLLPCAISYVHPAEFFGRNTGVRSGFSLLLGASKNDHDDDMAALMESLQNRRRALEEDQSSKRQAMLTASACTSTIAVVLPTWVRRIDVDFPLVVCGSSSSDIYVAHLETGQVLGIGRAATSEDAAKSSAKTISSERLHHVLQRMFGAFDGGGTLAIAVQGNVVCEAGRSGSVQVWRLDQKRPSTDDTEATIVPVFQGAMPALDGRLVTALRIADGLLFVGTDDGAVEAYSVSTLPLTTKPEYSWKVGDGSASVVLDLDVHVESGLAVVATDSGSVDLLSLDDPDSNQPLACFMMPSDGSAKEPDSVFPTSCCIVEESSSPSSSVGSVRKSYALACASNAGNVYLHPILGLDDDDQTFTFGKQSEFTPRHFGSVQCMTSPLPGILVTGAHDGTIRVWDTQEEEMQYQFVGYKVWLGSLCSDGVRIVSDGADNTIITHVFEPVAASDTGSEKRDDERSEDRK